MRRLAPLAALALSGCVHHIEPYVPKHREYELPAAHNAPNAGGSEGSLFSDASDAAGLVADQRARRVNDLVVILIQEHSTAQRETSTETSKDDQYDTKLNEILGFIKAAESAHSNFSGANALNIEHKADFKGGGKTSRDDDVQATVPAQVRQVLPNGDLFVEGHRVVLVNSEEHHFYISGVVRPSDIDGDNVVLSSRIADAQIEFTGRGNLTRGSEKGWFSNLLDYIWPF
jgi:flagellar L-ring protein precursor FlgH